MKEYHTTTTIEATPETIWAILTDAPNYLQWNPVVERIEGRIAPGEKFVTFTKLSPGQVFPAKVTEFVPHKYMKWSGGMPLGLFKGERTFTLVPQGNGTIEFTVREVLSGPLLPLIGRSIPDMTSPFEQFVASLKQHTERTG